VESLTKQPLETEVLEEETKKAYNRASTYLEYADKGAENNLFSFKQLKNRWDYNDLITWQQIEDEIIRSQANDILDIGCGAGSWVLRIAHRFPNVKVVGIDYSPVQILRAKNLLKNYPYLSDKVEFRVGNAKKLDFDNNSFDLSICIHDILNHISDYHTAINEMGRVSPINIVSVHTFGESTCYICDKNDIQEYSKEGDMIRFRKNNGEEVIIYEHLFTMDEIRESFAKVANVKKIFGIGIFASQIIEKSSKFNYSTENMISHINVLESSVNTIEDFANESEHILLVAEKKKRVVFL